MSELTKKRMRYEILEEVECFLHNRIKSCEEEIEWRSAREDGEELSSYQKDEIQKKQDEIAEYREVIKALPKLG